MERPVLTTFNQFAPLLLQTYERYLPTAFDESLSLIQKVNKVIMYLNQIGELTNGVVEQWNEVMEWVMSDGLSDTIIAKLDAMVVDGTLATIINKHIFEELNKKIDDAQTTLIEHKKEIDDNQQQHVEDMKDMNDLHKTDVETINLSLNTVKTDLGQRGVNVKNYPTLQDALNAGAGGRVEIPSGVYDVPVSLYVSSDTHVVGIGKVVLKRSAPINSIMLNKNTGMGGYVSNQNITIENITFDANNNNITGDCTILAFGHANHIKVINNVFLGNRSAWHDLELNACRDVLVEGNSFEDYKGLSEVLQLDFMGTSTQFPWFGPYDGTHCENITIKGNIFRSEQRKNVAIGNHSFGAGSILKNIVIEDNTIEEFRIAVSLNDVHGLYIRDNYMLNCVKGVYYSEYSNDSRNWFLDRNTFLATRDYGGNDEVEGRFFEGYPTNPVLGLWDIFIRGNKITKARTHAIGFTCNQGAIIADNIISASGANGIYVFGGKDIKVNNNFITGSNQKSEANRADVVVGNNGLIPATFVNVQNNNLVTVIANANITSCLIANNYIKETLTKGTGVESHNNYITGVWTP